MTLSVVVAFMLIGMTPVNTGRSESGNNAALNFAVDHVVFSEVLYRENRSGEWFELYNPTNQTIDLEGFEIESDSDLSIYIGSGYSIAPGSFFTIAHPSDQSNFRNVHGFDADLYHTGFVGLNDKKDRLRLFDPNWGEVDMVAWDKSGYRDFRVGRGNSIIRTNPNIDTDSDDDWEEGPPEGDPGTQASTNQPPVAEVNGPYRGSVGQAISFSSAGSNDPDGSIAVYFWEFGDGSSSGDVNPDHSYTSPGTYTVQLTISDNEGAVTVATTTAEVIIPNRSPFVNINGPYSGTVGQPVSFSSEGTNDPDGTIVSYAWDFGDGAASCAEVDAFWSMDNSTDDVSGNGNNERSDGNTPDFSTERIEGTHAALFNGSNHQIRYSQDGGFMESPYSTISFSAWVKPSDVSGDRIIYEEGGGVNGFILWLNNGVPTATSRSGGAGSERSVASSSALIPDSKWYHLAAVFDEGDITIYVDGISNSISVDYDEIPAHTSDGGIGGDFGGTSHSGSNGNYAGLMDGVKYSNSVAWESSEIDFNCGGSSQSANPTYTYSEAGTYTVTLTVTDDDGAQTTETTTVQIVAASNTFTWSGSEGSAWESTDNWEGGLTPGSTPEKDIEIPSSANSPVLSSSVTLSGISLDIADGADLTISTNGSLRIENDGAVTTEGTAVLILDSGSDYINKSSSTPFLEIRRDFTGNKGWRMVSSPLRQSFGDLFDGDLVIQGFTGSDFPDLQPNLLYWDETNAGTTLQGWRTAQTITDSTVSGKGYFYYVFDGAGRPDNDQSYTDELPVTMTIRGRETNVSGGYSFENLTYTPRDTTDQSSEENAVFIERNVADKGWNLIGNPTPSALDWDSQGWTKTNISETIYVWDPAANSGVGDYKIWNGTTGSLGSGIIAPMQAIWVMATAPSPTLSFDDQAKTAAGVFRGKQQQGPLGSLQLTARFEGFSKSTWITLSDQAEEGLDRWDAFQLEGMTDSWMSFYTISKGLNTAMAINNLPSDVNGTTMVELFLGAYKNFESLDGEFTLHWDRSELWPADTYLYLQDAVTEQIIPIGQKSDSIRFYFNSPTTSRQRQKLKTTQAKVVQPEIPAFDIPQASFSGVTAARSKSSSTEEQARFTLIVSDQEIEDYLPTTPVLYQNYPNPFNPSTTIQFSVPEQSDVRLQIFDILGRMVAEPASGMYQTGTHQVSWNAGRLSSGMYIYRLIANGRLVQTEKMTLIK